MMDLKEALKAMVEASGVISSADPVETRKAFNEINEEPSLWFEAVEAGVLAAVEV